MPLFVRTIRRPRPVFDAHAGRCPVGLYIGGVHHDGLFVTMLGGETSHHPCEDALAALAVPAIVECLVRRLFRRRIAPTQAIALDEDNPIQHNSIIDARLAVGLW